MSWIFGMFAAGPVLADVGRWRSIHPPALHRIEDGPLYLAAGGLPETCLAGVSRSRRGEERWIAVGLSVQSASGEGRFFSSADGSVTVSPDVVCECLTVLRA